jgi:pimeloyl-ACP methyl ester carboxylesterase
MSKTSSDLGQSHFMTAPDGLKLHLRVFAPQGAAGLPVVCLPGLTRNTSDFEELAQALASDAAKPRRVLTLDYRGRGLSAHDPDPQNYNVMVELADVIAVVTAFTANPAIYIGTSRGGILTMLLAATHPGMIAGAVLNDIGPVIEMAGLMRIKSYVGKIPLPASFVEGAAILQKLFGEQFPRLTQLQWLAAARSNWREDKDRLILSYDPRLAETLKDVAPDQPWPALWEPFDALRSVPLMVLRGALSDLLSAETLQAMQARRKEMTAQATEIVEVADQGHPVTLSDPDMIERIKTFIAGCEAEYGA